MSNLKVNAWTEWGKLKTVVVGRADMACYKGQGIDNKNTVNDPELAKLMDWPVGKVKQCRIDKANEELDNFAKVLESRGIKVLRPKPFDFSEMVKTPHWSSPHHFCAACPRDVMITLGNTVLEAPMSKRARFFEYLAYRNVVDELWASDKEMKWKAAPKPSMNDDMYWEGFWKKFDGFEEKSDEEKHKLYHDWQYILTEKEMAFDAADIMKFGKDIFIQHSTLTNLKAIEWLKRELDGVVRVNALHFSNNKLPYHIDTTFLPLRPPRNGKKGIILTNPTWPLVEEERKLFADNNWELIKAPTPNKINFPMMPLFCASSAWLAMNFFQIDENTVVSEENEIEQHQLFESLGFEVVKIPFRNVYMFGGGLHCTTWDIEREDSNEDFFPNR